MKSLESHGATRSGVEELRTIYRETLDSVFGYLLMHTGGDRTLAEDLTAETYLHATRHVHRGRGEEVTVQWLKVVARRRLIDHWRAEERLARRTDRIGREMALRPNSGSEDGAVARQRIHDALATLAPEQRLVLVMRHLDGLSVSEIGNQIDRTENGVASLLSRARAAFRNAYGGDLDE